MQTKLSALVVAAVAVTSLLTATDAACAGNCNGYGSCGAWDRCTCYGSHADPNAEDCSNRVCPYGKSSGKIATDNHGYSECSDNGTCNRRSGLCECNEGFTGKACQRNECPSDCNGHGQCQTIETFDSSYNSLWDHDQTMVCLCDPGYEGPACERRMCPVGDDPLTLRSGFGGDQVDEVQTITITPSANAFDDTSFTLKFTDWTGQLHETRPLAIQTLTAMEVTEALQAFPNNVIPSVTVTVTGAGTPFTSAVAIAITFDSTDNAGTQPAITVDYSDKSAAGSQPVKGPLTCDGGTAIVAGDIDYTVTTAGTEESKVCSGRGTCDSELGTCTCFTGYYGHACASQTALQ
ncbi:Multiple epidermal growth factor-like domains protein 6 [Hondaea fermentalgiana]|uniref:Multiple epidermal growth factor-like domains protein 6 n=1 Tax=Hondaea fermentalgiana TaxID=2315210 RepID=A0A2R5GHH2_9STRA|nr:Multiple epidermal growth factor-like domains protein 6 [Hondaea fermentalgiana]|eukprot:GBG30332.1 Multiple epidermal growth factor-like domains protein 6 [Hondaea fermentalgiana]